MEAATATPSSYRSSIEPRFGRAAGRLVALAAAAAIALAAAGPALAGDVLPPVPTVPEPPAAESTETQPQPGPDPLSLPAPTAPSLPELDDSPVTVTVTDGEAGIDVSVRVLSPDDEGSLQEQSAEQSVVSPAPAADITDEPGSTLSTTEESATAPAASANVNVSIRVLSPGNDGPVDQVGARDAGSDALATREPDVEPPATADARPGSVPDSSAGDNGIDSTTPENPEQYHEANSRYQSDSQSDPSPWNWTWYLTLDCDGNVVSESAETGAQSSLDWVWQWAWEWSCNSPARPPPLAAAAAEVANEPSQSAPPAGSGGASPATEQGSEGGSEFEPWRWTWTFTFCGETVSATMPISTESALAWQWDWIWNWTCEPGASSPEPSAPDVSSPAPSAQTPEPSGATQGAGEPGPPSLDTVALPTWVISLFPFAELFSPPRTAHAPLAKTFETGTLEMAVVLEIAWPSPSELVPALLDTVDGTLPIVSPSLSPRRPEHPGGVPAPGHAQPARPSGPAGTRETPGEAKSSRPRHPGTATTSKQRGRSSSTRRSPLAPPGLPPLQTPGPSSASGSFVPSGSVLGTAALVALFILAAPGFGRRVRVAPELRPRGTYGSSIDHPG